jgi:recombination protein RecA
MQFSQLQKEILIGILLGDASLSWNRNQTKARLSLRQKNKFYFDHLCDVFQNYITAKPRQNKQTGVWECDTRFFSEFRFYKKEFYTSKFDEFGNQTNTNKVPRLIHRWLTPQALAYWYMDDGSQKWKGRSSGVRFCTDCFTHQEVKRLAAVLTTLYGVKTSTFFQRKTLRIYISGRGKNAITFGKLLIPFIHPSMMYKIPTSWFHKNLENKKLN